MLISSIISLKCYSCRGIRVGSFLEKVGEKKGVANIKGTVNYFALFYKKSPRIVAFLMIYAYNSSIFPYWNILLWRAVIYEVY